MLGLKKKKKKSETGNSRIFCFGRAQPRVAIGVCTCYVFRHIYPLYFYLCALCVCVCAFCVRWRACTRLGADETTRKLWCIFSLACLGVSRPKRTKVRSLNPFFFLSSFSFFLFSRFPPRNSKKMLNLSLLMNKYRPSSRKINKSHKAKKKYLEKRTKPNENSDQKMFSFSFLARVCLEKNKERQASSLFSSRVWIILCRSDFRTQPSV